MQDGEEFGWNRIERKHLWQYSTVHNNACKVIEEQTSYELSKG